MASESSFWPMCESYIAGRPSGGEYATRPAFLPLVRASGRLIRETCFGKTARAALRTRLAWMPNPSFYNEPAFAPFPVSAQRVAGGLYGQKTGAGWYLGLPLSAPEGR